jgi:inorganic pyrophosphatase
MKNINQQELAHPWHGVSIGENAPHEVFAFIEITPFDTIKYEIEKESGLMMIDRPQKYSNVVPALYGFVPRTYCGEKIAQYGKEHGMQVEKGDGDPLDILVLSSHPISKNGILVKAIPIGGIALEDGLEADDKIIAVLKEDPIYSNYKNIEDLPKAILEKITHYFLTYKNLPEETSVCKISRVYDSETAKIVIEKASQDYQTLISN